MGGFVPCDARDLGSAACCASMTASSSPTFFFSSRRVASLLFASLRFASLLFSPLRFSSLLFSSSQVKDWDRFSSHDMIGVATFDAAKVYQQPGHETHRQWVGLLDPTSTKVSNDVSYKDPVS